MTLTKVEESRDPSAPRIDWPGQLTLTPALSLLVLALLRGNEDGWTSAIILAELGAAAAFFAAFIAIERRAGEPLLPLGLFRSGSFTGAQIGAFAISASFFAVFIYSTLYLQQVLGLSPIEAGLVYVPGTVAMFMVSGVTATLQEKGVHPGILISVGLVLVATGMALLTSASVDSSWTVVLPGSVVALIGTGMFNPAVIAVALGSAPAEKSGLAAGVNDTFRQAGIAVGVAALGALVPAEHALGGSAIDYVAGLDKALLAGAGLAAIGAIATAVLIRKPRAVATTPEPAMA